jgi:kynurenine formamidase
VRAVTGESTQQGDDVMRWKTFVGLSILFFVLVALQLVYRNAEVTADAVPASRDNKNAAFLSHDVRMIDLTHSFDDNTIYWPTEIPFHLELGFAGMTTGGWYYAANRFSMAEHCGTHLDAPIHFSKGAHTVDEIPLARLAGAAVVIDVVKECADNADFLVTTDVFQAWEKRNNRRLDEAIVLVRTGFGQFWPDRARYLGTAGAGKEAVAKLHFPGVDPEAAAWLVAERRIKAIGIDTASIDRGQSKTFATHVALCAHDTPAFENVAQLEQLPDHGFSVIALPMKIRGGSGGPLRIIAMVPDGK